MDTRKYAKMLMASATVVLVALWITSALATDPKVMTKIKPVNLNTATMEELAAVPAIGADKAKLILEYRNQNGPFAKVDDLLKVSGIDKKLLDKAGSQIIVEPAAPAAPEHQGEQMAPATE